VEKGEKKALENALNGTLEFFDPRGNVYVRASFENGMMHGIYREFFDEERKILKIEGRYEEGVRQGVWTEYNRSANVEGVEIFNRGELLERTLYEGEEE